MNHEVPAFHGFLYEEECAVHLCYTPSAPRHDGVYATAYYTSPIIPQQDVKTLKLAVSVCDDVLGDIADWEDKALAEAVEEVKLRLQAILDR